MKRQRDLSLNIKKTVMIGQVSYRCDIFSASGPFGFQTDTTSSWVTSKKKTSVPPLEETIDAKPTFPEHNERHCSSQQGDAKN